ncbi:MAG TPA: MFS transporter [Candidatus Elarobacter sp.]|nr:MFS transporter [Candidatus Elarobacter sp.]
MRLKPFAAYLAAFVAFDLASQIQSVAIAWQVYSVRHNPFDLGLVGLVLFTPSLLLAPVTGLVADRVDRRRIVAAASVLQLAVCAALIPLAGLHGAHGLTVTMAVLALAGTARAFRYPAVGSLLPAIVPAEGYVRASSTASAVREVVTIGGPALGGVLVALGPLFAYGSAIAAFAFGAIGVLLIAMPKRVRSDTPFAWNDVLAGIAFLRRKPVLAGAISLDLFAVLFGGATALLPIYAAQIFHVGPAGFGALRAADAIGTAICAVAIARRPIHRYAGPRLLIAVACFGAATVVFGLSTSIWIALPALAVAGAADMVSVAIRDALVALGTPDAMRGRVGAVEGVFIIASNELGGFESGTLAAFVGAVPAVVAGGLATLAVVALWAWRNPSLRRADAISAA